MTSMITEARPVRFSGPPPEAVDVVVIGAGVAGTATAYFLAEAGVRVLLCEKGRVAGEQSSRNWGWVRQQGRDWAELPIMMESNRIWRGLAERTGEADLVFTESGCLRLTDDPKVAAGYEAWRELSVQHQLETRLLSADEVARAYPAIAPPAGKRWLAGMLTPSDGRAEPFVAIPALARAAERAGAAVIEQCAVRTLERSGGRIAGVVTELGPVRAERVVLAGGAWSTHFAHNEGLALPQLAVRSTVARTEPAPEVYGPNLSTPGLTLRRRADGGYTITSGDLAEHFVGPNSVRWFFKYQPLLKKSARDVKLIPAAPRGYPGAWGTPRRWQGTEVTPFERARVLNPDPSPVVVRRIGERLAGRFPDLAGTRLAEAWAGMIDVTPDAVPYIAEDHRLPGLFVATGLSGHGFGIGPGVGRVLADLVQGRPSGHDLTRFRTARFFDGSAIAPGPY
ncbi:MAG: FAD-binding oxidoreductase [Alphaproteobacteria bacterium]|nr:FAD-binding oxidoreductase [Alphaproteobacteria bacterium]MCB9928244.1 FAD-binding oxidoreductase [Alphaproteobacteria bacterium]